MSSSLSPCSDPGGPPRAATHPSALLGWFLHWIVTKDLVYARYLRVVDRSGNKNIIVLHMALLGENKAKYRIKGGRMTKPDTNLQAIISNDELPEPKNFTGEVFHTTHWGDWRRAIKDDTIFAQSSGGGCMLEFDYGKDVLAERVILKTGYGGTTAADSPEGQWVELWNDELVKVYEFALNQDVKFDLKVKLMAFEPED